MLIFIRLSCSSLSLLDNLVSHHITNDLELRNNVTTENRHSNKNHGLPSNFSKSACLASRPTSRPVFKKHNCYESPGRLRINYVDSRKADAK